MIISFDVSAIKLKPEVWQKIKPNENDLGSPLIKQSNYFLSRATLRIFNYLPNRWNQQKCSSDKTHIWFGLLLKKSFAWT